MLKRNDHSNSQFEDGHIIEVPVQCKDCGFVQYASGICRDGTYVFDSNYAHCTACGGQVDELMLSPR